MKLTKKTIYISSDGRELKLIILKPAGADRPLPGILWLHGGGFITGMPEMVNISRGKDIAASFGAVVVSPGYRLSASEPYPAALHDAYAALLYMKKHSENLGIRKDQILVGGESAGGGLTAALCMYARDLGTVNIAFQIPLYPMLDCYDTESSADNHGYLWNTNLNHIAWKAYLGPLYQSKNIPPYASPARCTDYSGLPPAYTFVCTGEPFYCETLKYIENLNAAGIPAEADVYPGKTHAFDMMRPHLAVSKKAKKVFLEKIKTALQTYYADNPD